MKRILAAFIIVFSLSAEKAPKPLKPGLYAIFNTEFGTFRAQLFEKETPSTVAVFVGLAQGTQPWRDPKGVSVKKPMYNDTTFFRILPETVIQAGSPIGNAAYNCGFTIPDEILPGLRFRSGSLAMANGGPNTGSCQFFFTTGPAPTWDGKYTIFGQVVEGEEVVNKISKVPVKDETPVNPPKLISVTLERLGPPPVSKTKKK